MQRPSEFDPSKQFISTKGYRAAIEVLTELYERGRGMAVIHGDYGVGKTDTVCSFALGCPGRLVYLDSRVKPDLKTLEKALHKGLTGYEEEATRYWLERAIDEELASETVDVIVADEVHRFHLDLFEQLRRHLDCPDAKAVLVMVGGTNTYAHVVARQAIRSRLYRVLAYPPLFPDEYMAALAQFDPLFADADPDLVFKVAAKLDGAWRLIVSFRDTCRQRMPKLKKKKLDLQLAEVALTVMGRI